MKVEFDFDEFDNMEVDASLHNNETGMIGRSIKSIKKAHFNRCAIL